MDRPQIPLGKEQLQATSRLERPDISSVAYSLEAKPRSQYPFELMQYLLHDLLGKTHGFAVDLGCGRGDHVRAIEALGLQAVGVDRERQSAQSLVAPDQHLVCDFAVEKLPFADNSVDLIFSKSVIEHLYYFELPHYMNEIKRVLKPGGVLVLVSPDWHYCWRSFFGGFTHCTPYTVGSLVHCLTVYGFEQIRGQSLIQLPRVWRSKFFRFLSDVTLHLPLPPRGKWVRWSKERQALVIGVKP